MLNKFKKAMFKKYPRVYHLFTVLAFPIAVFILATVLIVATVAVRY